MAIIEHTTTRLSNRLFLVKWESVGAGDTGQPFDAHAAICLSRHSYRNIAGNADVKLFASNEIDAPTHGINIATISITSLEDIIKARWYWPSSPASSETGTVDLVLLFQEV